MLLSPPPVAIATFRFDRGVGFTLALTATFEVTNRVEHAHVECLSRLPFLLFQFRSAVSVESNAVDFLPQTQRAPPTTSARACAPGFVVDCVL